MPAGSTHHAPQLSHGGPTGGVAFPAERTEARLGHSPQPGWATALAAGDAGSKALLTSSMMGSTHPLP